MARPQGVEGFGMAWWAQLILWATPCHTPMVVMVIVLVLLTVVVEMAEWRRLV
jgi:hypothetical protein